MMARTNIMILACLSPSVYDYTCDGVRLQGFFVSYLNFSRMSYMVCRLSSVPLCLCASVPLFSLALMPQ